MNRPYYRLPKYDEVVRMRRLQMLYREDTKPSVHGCARADGFQFQGRTFTALSIEFAY